MFIHVPLHFVPTFVDSILTAIGQLPVRFKEFWGLPLADRGIDSLALNLSVAVQAKDYEKFVPLNRLATRLGGIVRAHQMWIPSYRRSWNFDIFWCLGCGMYEFS